MKSDECDVTEASAVDFDWSVALKSLCSIWSKGSWWAGFLAPVLRDGLPPYLQSIGFIRCLLESSYRNEFYQIRSSPSQPKRIDLRKLILDQQWRLNVEGSGTQWTARILSSPFRLQPNSNSSSDNEHSVAPYGLKCKLDQFGLT